MADSAWAPSFAAPVPSLRVAPRHTASVRVTHWSTALCFFTLLISGVEILISHARLIRRMRVPRHLVYKSWKYLNRITVTDSLKNFGKGLGSLAPEGGYAWYAGI